MPRKRAKVRALFTAETEGPSCKIPKVRCKFCRWMGVDNGTRMAEHIRNCSACPADVRAQYFNPEVENPTVESKPVTSTSSVASSSSMPLSASVGKVSASSSSSLKVLLSSFVDRVTAAEQEDIDELLARAIFASGTPLTITENKHWKTFFTKMRPAYVPPTRYVLTSRLLTAEHARLHAKVSEKVASADTLALTCDGWSNCRNESIVNFIVTTPEPVFYKSITTEKNRHTGVYMAEVMTTVLEEVGPNRFLAIVTDNASNMKKAWDELKKLYPHLSCYGCIAHGLQLLLTDIGKLDTVKDIVTKLKMVMKEIRNSHILAASFKQHAKCALRLPVVTRWGSIVTSLGCMLKNKGPLRHLAVDEYAEPDMSKECKSVILNDVFWDRQQALYDLLNPIASWITKLEGDTPQLGVVAQVFAEITQHFDSTLSKSPLLKKEEQGARVALCSRREFCLTGIHKAAHLLDPRFCGMNLSEEEIVDASEFIFNTATWMHVDPSKAMADLAEYRAKHGLWGKEFVWASAKHVLPHVWWSGVCGSRQALSVVASRILNMPASSAACERSFSSYGNIHTAKRNRLTNETAGKLVYVYHNLRHITSSDADNITPISRTYSPDAEPGAGGVSHSVADDRSGGATDITSEVEEEDEYSVEESSIESDEEPSEEESVMRFSL